MEGALVAAASPLLPRSSLAVGDGWLQLSRLPALPSPLAAGRGAGGPRGVQWGRR